MDAGTSSEVKGRRYRKFFPFQLNILKKEESEIAEQIEELKIKALHLNDLRARVMNCEGLLKAVTGEDLPEILKKAEDNKEKK